MKSPADLRMALKRQWHSATRRETRLLDAENAWPIVMSIGRPSAKQLQADLDAVKRHVEAWRKEKIGSVVWDDVAYRATAEPVTIPIAWKLHKPSEWIAACGDRAVREEFDALAALVAETDPIFHAIFVRRRSLWRDKPLTEVLQAARLAAVLAPGAAQGRPLRMLSLAGVDTKFFERNARLVTSLLDARFDGEASARGLEAFLDAPAEQDHWLLLADLDGSLLPFKKLRVRSSELTATAPPGTRLLIVENEQCQHHLPEVPGTLAVLGAGSNLHWAGGAWLAERRVAYWGDVDTWGLLLLGRARQAIAHLDALMMTEETFERFAEFAVEERVHAGLQAPEGLRLEEGALYMRLLGEPRGRLEQEFLPVEYVKNAIRAWAGELGR